jgi:hypothetical protein
MQGVLLPLAVYRITLYAGDHLEDGGEKPEGSAGIEKVVQYLTVLLKRRISHCHTTELLLFSAFRDRKFSQR